MKKVLFKHKSTNLVQNEEKMSNNSAQEIFGTIQYCSLRWNRWLKSRLYIA